MVFEKFIRYASLAVGLKPPATGCEARLRGLERIIPFPIADFGLQIAAHGVTMSDDGNDNAELPTGFGIIYSKTMESHP